MALSDLQSEGNGSGFAIRFLLIAEVSDSAMAIDFYGTWEE